MTDIKILLKILSIIENKDGLVTKPNIYVLVLYKRYENLAKVLKFFLITKFKSFIK